MKYEYEDTEHEAVGREKRDLFKEALRRRLRQNTIRKQAGQPIERDPIARGFGRYIRATRLNKGYSYAALAERTGFDPGQIKTIEAGLFDPEAMENRCVHRLAEGLEAPAGDFFLLLGRRGQEAAPAGAFCMMTETARITIEPRQPQSFSEPPRLPIIIYDAIDAAGEHGYQVKILFGEEALQLIFQGFPATSSRSIPTQITIDYMGMGWKSSLSRQRAEREVRDKERQFMDK